MKKNLSMYNNWYLNKVVIKEEPLKLLKITPEEWEQTPESVKLTLNHLVENFEKRITALEEENNYLRKYL